MTVFLCATHTQRVLIFDHGIYHAIDGHLCDSSHVVTPAGPRPAETLREQAQVAEGAVGTP